VPRILGIDYGERRVGFAVSDPAGVMATPLRIAEVRSDREAVDEVRRACADTEAERVVIGLPLTLKGERGPMAAKVEAFGRAVAAALGLPVEFWDERFSTATVERTLLDADMSRRRRKEVRDKLAAQVTLQCYLDAKAAASGPSPERWDDE